MDKYDAAIKYLADNPHEIEIAWRSPSKHIAGCLFAFAITIDTGVRATGALAYGCLTQIRLHAGYGVTAPTVKLADELTRAIKADQRIPLHPHNIMPDNLPVFAEWQRKLDMVLRG